MFRFIFNIALFAAASGLFSACKAQTAAIPGSYANLSYDETGALLAKDASGNTFKLHRKPARFPLQGVTPRVAGYKDGLQFQFSAPALKGARITYGLIPYGQHKYPSAVLRFTAVIDSNGNALLPIRRDLREGYDHTGWQKSGYGVVGYRLSDVKGLMVYEGKQAFRASAESFRPAPTILRGPFISQLNHHSAVIWYDSSEPVPTHIQTDAAPAPFVSAGRQTRHEYELRGLQPDSLYRYTVYCDSAAFRFSFRTAPAPGARKRFTFAYASDSRSGYGGGERDIYGANAQIMGRIGALARRENAAFVQFTGDLANGYLSDPDEWALQNINWLHAVEPYWHYMPFNVGMGNHESLGWASEKDGIVVADGFPYETHSAEAAFGRLFVNPLNGPQSEDDAPYDPNPGRSGDFPSYSENVYHYRYDNTAMVVLNSNYWYAPILRRTQMIGGNLHGYIMDEQMRWLKNVLAAFEADSTLDHVFVTVHTPPFPNGGHRGDCMWYNGDNSNRPWVAGKPVEKGIIERRDELLDLCANQSSKVRSFLCGDEHNYNRMVVEESTPRYPAGWDKPRTALRRPLWQVINGAAGAPFYAQQESPWSGAVEGFTVQNALCLFDIEGEKVYMRVINPDTLEEIDAVRIR